MAQENSIIKVGHRGAAGYEPENTLRSFEKAIELGVDMVELDVYVLKSGELMVIHDDTVDRTTNSKGKVEDKTLSELKELDAGRGEKIPTLDEVLDLVDKRAEVNIELKGSNIAKPVSDMIEHYVEDNGWKYDDFLVSSFNHGELKKFKEISPKVKIGLLVEEIPDGFINFAKNFDAWSVNVSIKFITQEFADKTHENGLKVYVWTVNTPDEIEKTKSLNADYICSDYPEKI
jgi:glycerophosphoryl diester phosphodiesterase